MKKQILKGTELELSAMCLGTGNFGGKLDYRQSFELLDRFRDIGGSFIDTANVYCKWIPGMNNSRPFQVFPVGAVSGTEQLADFSTAGELVLDDQLIRTFEEFGVEI